MVLNPTLTKCKLNPTCDLLVAHATTTTTCISIGGSYLASNLEPSFLSTFVWSNLNFQERSILKTHVGLLPSFASGGGAEHGRVPHYEWMKICHHENVTLFLLDEKSDHPRQCVINTTRY